MDKNRTFSLLLLIIIYYYLPIVSKYKNKVRTRNFILLNISIRIFNTSSIAKDMLNRTG